MHARYKNSRNCRVTRVWLVWLKRTSYGTAGTAGARHSVRDHPHNAAAAAPSRLYRELRTTADLPVLWEKVAGVEVDDVAPFFHLGLHGIAKLSPMPWQGGRQERRKGRRERKKVTKEGLGDVRITLTVIYYRGEKAQFARYQYTSYR